MIALQETECCALAGTDCRPPLVRPRAGRPQLKRDPLAGAMSQRQLASVLFAALGAFIAITGIPEIGVSIGILAAGVQAAPIPYAIALLIGTIIAFILGIALVLSRVRLAERLFPADTGSLPTRDTQAVALSVLGCYYVVESISRLVGRGRIEWSAVTQLVLGIGLFFGARGVARFWAAVRSAGSSSSNERAA